MMSYENIASTINTQEWGINNSPEADELINLLTRFSITKLKVKPATIIIEFANRLFTLYEMVDLVTTLKASRINVISTNELRLWWD
jgi:hypothetical protein